MNTPKNDISDLFLQSVIDCVPECILVISPDYEVKLMNRAAREFSLERFGASESQQCYKIFHHREKPCIAPGHNCPLEEVRKTGKPAKVVHEHYNSNGEKISVEILSSPLYGADGTFQGIIQCSRDITMSTQAKKDLMATIAAAEDEKNRSEAIITALGDGIIIQDTDYKIIYQNQIQKDLYGDRKGELCYRAYENNDNICEDCPIEKTFKDGKIHRSERRIATDKGVSYYELTSSPLKDSKGKIIAGVKIVRDLTMRKHAEEKLREGEKFLESIFESIQDGIGIIDSEMNIIKVNKTAETWYPHAFPLIGKKCYEAYHNRKEHCELCPAQETLVTGDSAYRIVPKHGPGGKEVGWLEIYSYPLKDAITGQMKGVIEYVRDISERKLVEEKLRQSEEKYRLLIENIMEGVFIIQDAKMQFVNKAFEKITGYRIEEIIGKDFRHFVAPEDLEMVQDRYSRRQKWEDVPGEYEFHMLRRDGKKIIVNMSVGIVTYRGRIASMGILWNITERKNIEEAIKKYNRELEESNHIKELFTDIMHHDLLNPLNVAHGYVELFLEDETNHQKKSYLETIRRNLLKGMELIENAMKLSKLESMKNIEFEELDLKMVVGEAVDNLTPLAIRAGMSIEKKLNGRMTARANKIIEDIFINIISNAIKYASYGKKIVVEGKDGGNSWIISVVDFGPGIKDEDKKMVFERFHREEKKGVKGSGLGLAIAGKIVELHKGRIWVEDNPEGGAIFTVEIPKS